jgi:hypothetical protein
MLVLEMTIVIKSDDKLELEFIENNILTSVRSIATPLTTEIVVQPIVEEAQGDEEKP